MENSRKYKEDKLPHHGSMPPTKTTVLSDVHFWPAAPKPAAAIAFKVESILASGITTA